ncbi:MAG: methyltransferase [Succinivibrio sp.]
MSLPVTQLLERNADIFYKRNIILTGDLYDASVLALVKNSEKAYIVCDNFITFETMAAMMGVAVDNSCPQKVEYKHVELYFDSPENAAAKIKDADTLVLLVSKNQQQSVKLLNLFKSSLKAESIIYTAGSNDGGGKSADSMLKVAGLTRKADTARKCTLFKTILNSDFNTYTAPSSISVKVLGEQLKLKQDDAVFSKGRIDNGTALLLDAIGLSHTKDPGKVLDLGCGCGVVGIALAKHGAMDVTCTDVSAAALLLTKENAVFNSVPYIKVQSSDMLNGTGVYDLIAVNPPFHVGLNTTTAPAVNMIINAKDHLTDGGKMFLVANSHLGYEKILKENFKDVRVVKSTNAFVVYLATKN